ATKMYPGQLPLFPVIYSLQVRFVDEPEASWITWDSKLPQHTTPYQELKHPVVELEPPHRVRAIIHLRYQLHAYNKQQQADQLAGLGLRWISVLAVAGTVPAILGIYLGQRRERERERQKATAQRQVDQAERLRLEEELRRREAEQHREEAERKLLEQRLATQV